MIFNNSNQKIEIFTGREKCNIQEHYSKTMYFPTSIKPHVGKLMIVNDLCTYHYYLNIEGLRTDNFDYIRMKNYKGVIRLQLNQDKKLYLVFPNIKKFPVDQKELDKMQINGFPISPIRVECNKK